MKLTKTCMYLIRGWVESWKNGFSEKWNMDNDCLCISNSRGSNKGMKYEECILSN